jgi:predicted NBD/HSP70 family sugar kinase
VGQPQIIGVDIGGTKVAAGLVDSAGNITQKTRVPMVATGDAATWMPLVCQHSLLRKRRHDISPRD